MGFFLVAFSGTVLLIGLQWGGAKFDWMSPEVLGTIGIGLIGFVVFILWLFWKGETALIPPRLLKPRINTMIAITSFVQSGATQVSLYWLPFWFQAIQERTAFQSGLSLLPLIITQLVFSVICGVLVSRIGYYLPEVAMGNLLVSIGTGLATTLNPSSSMGEQMGYQVLIGAGRGLVLQLVRFTST
jgi:hypothetical protein